MTLFYHIWLKTVSKGTWTEKVRNAWAPAGGRNHLHLPIMGDPGAVSRAGRKGVMKVFKHRQKSPWVPTSSHRTISKWSSMNAGSWLGTKNALYYFCPITEEFLLSFFSCVPTRQLLSCHSCLVRSTKIHHQAFLTRNEGTTIHQ